MTYLKRTEDSDSLAERFIDSPVWSGSFYADDSLNLLHERFNELLLERRKQIEKAGHSMEELRSSLRSTGAPHPA